MAYRHYIFTKNISTVNVISSKYEIVRVYVSKIENVIFPKYES